MTSNLLIFGGIAFGYIFFAIMYYNYVSNIENEDAGKRAQNIFIVINILLLSSAMAYAYISFAHS
jgi:hypothetical protein